MIPEYIILIFAIACVGSGVVLYYDRGNVAALGIVIVSFIAVLYGVGQYIERDNVEARALGFADAAERRAAKETNISDGEAWKRRMASAEVRNLATKPENVPGAKQREDASAAQRLPQPEVTKLDSLSSQQLDLQGTLSATVIISNFTSNKAANRYVEISGTVSNRNEFAIRNIVVKCGDKSFAAGDVSAVVDKVVPAKSDLQVAGLRMGPINPGLPPTTCAVAKYERAN